MIVMGEDYLQDVIQRRFAYLKENPLYIKDILHLPEERLNKLIKTISNSPVIPVIKGQPATKNSVTNVICIFLGDEDEELGGIADYEFEDWEPKISTVRTRLTPGNTLLMPPNTVSVRSVQHEPTGMFLDDDQYEYDLTLHSIKIYNQNHADKTVFSVQFVHDLGEGEQVQTTFNPSYRIEVWSNNGDYLTELYGLLKWAVLSARTWLGKEAGFLKHHIKGSDQQFKSDYFPNFAYKRSLTYTTMVEESAIYPGDEGGTPHYVDRIEVYQKEYRE